MNIAGLKRDLQLFKISDNLQIAPFILFGDVEVTKASAKALLELAPEYDVLFTAECKSLPLIYEMAKQNPTVNFIAVEKISNVILSLAERLKEEFNKLDEETRKKFEENLDEERYIHTLGVMDAAEELAKTLSNSSITQTQLSEHLQHHSFQ